MSYVDTDKLIEFANNSKDKTIDANDIARFPTADVRENVRGEWTPHSETSREYIGTVLINVSYDYWFCDACGYRVEKGQPMYKFCPNCGADMRGES